MNTILTIKDENGDMVKLFKGKEEARNKYFKNIFTEPEGSPIQDILRELILFPNMVGEEMNKNMVEEVVEKALENIVHSFKKGKSRGRDGFTIQFYQVFFDLLKNDPLNVVRE